MMRANDWRKTAVESDIRAGWSVDHARRTSGTWTVKESDGGV